MNKSSFFNNSEVQKGKINVANFFLERRGFVVPMLPGIDINAILNNFDKPELLSVIYFDSLALVCLESKAGKIADEMEKGKKKLEQLGITRERLMEMSPEERFDLKKKLPEL